MLEKMYQTYKDSIDFVTVYIKEAHPTDDWHMDKIIDYTQPKNLTERKAALQKLYDMYDPKMPIVMDDMTDQLEKAYSSWPERLYVLQNGKILWIGGVGPFNYSVPELEKWLKKREAVHS